MCRRISVQPPRHRRAARQGPLTINPLAGPPLTLDLTLIEPARRALSPLATAFLAILEAEARRINRRWDYLGEAAEPG